MGKLARYDENAHGEMPWEKFRAIDKSTHPVARGRYTSVVDKRCHWWVADGYRWNGTYWVTPGGSVATSNVIYYLPVTQNGSKEGTDDDP